MALLQECPTCRRRNSAKAKSCKCGQGLSKLSGRVWWISYYQDGKLRRERIGPSRQAAEQRFREVLTARTEGRYIRRSPDGITRFKGLCEWYLSLAEVQAKRSYSKDKMHCKRLIAEFGDKLLKDISPAMVESYKQKRVKEISYRKRPTRPTTVNRELTTLKTIFNKAVRNGEADRNPAQVVKPFKEDNARDRILSEEEFARLLAHSPDHLKAVLMTAYFTAMRRGEILGLVWGQVDLREGFIKLQPENTKTKEGRLVPLCQELIDMFTTMSKGLPEVPVFLYQGHSMGEMKRSFKTACKRAGIENFTFHDFRHTAINNWRLQGHDYFRIMAASGHKTMSVFKRYNTVSKEELKTLVGG